MPPYWNVTNRETNWKLDHVGEAHACLFHHRKEGPARRVKRQRCRLAMSRLHAAPTPSSTLSVTWCSVRCGHTARKLREVWLWPSRPTAPMHWTRSQTCKVLYRLKSHEKFFDSGSELLDRKKMFCFNFMPRRPRGRWVAVRLRRLCSCRPPAFCSVTSYLSWNFGGPIA